MALYSVRQAKKDQTSHTFLIGAPLALISLFCFGYTLWQPQAPKHAAAASNHPSPVFAEHTESNLPNLSFKNLPELALVIPAGGPNGLATPGNTSAASLQPQASSGKHLNLQAGPNDQPSTVDLNLSILKGPQSQH